MAVAAVAVAATSAASAATVYDKDGTSLAVYGRIQGVVYSHAAGEGKTMNSYQDTGLQGSGRLGFDMRTQLTDGIAAFAKAEWEMADNGEGRGGNRIKDGDDSFASRYLWVGVDFGKFGSVKFGKFEDAVKYVLLPTDIFDDWGCNGQLDNDDKRDGMIMYTWSGYGFTANVSYQTAKDNQLVDGAWYTGTEEKLDINDGYSVSVGYQSPDVLFGPIGVRLGYAHVDFQSNEEIWNNSYIDASGKRVIDGTYIYDDYDQVAASLYWGDLNVGPYVGALYQMRDFGMRNGADDYKVQGAEFVVAYGFENGVSLRAGYNWMNHDEDNGPDVDAHTVPVIAMYNVTPNFRIWGEARFDVGTDDGDKSFDEATGATTFEENIYSIGARYTF